VVYFSRCFPKQISFVTLVINLGRYRLNLQSLHFFSTI